MDIQYYRNDRSEVLAFLPKPIGKLLEVGCGCGHFGRAVKRAGAAEVWGVEPEPSAAAEAAKILDRIVVGFFDGKCDLPHGYFDVIVFNDSFEHITDSVSTLRVTKQLLRPEGHVLFSIPNMRHWRNLRHLLFEKDWRYEASGVRDQTHVRFFTLLSFKRLLEDNGFIVLHQEGILGISGAASIVAKIAAVLSFGLCADMPWLQFITVAKMKHKEESV